MSFVNDEDVKSGIEKMNEWISLNLPMKYFNLEDFHPGSFVDDSRTWTVIDEEEFCFALPGYATPQTISDKQIIGYYLVERQWDVNDLPIAISQDFYCPDCDLTGEDEEGEICETCEGEPVEWVEFDPVNRS
jgi:hypothetical protein